MERGLAHAHPLRTAGELPRRRSAEIGGGGDPNPSRATAVCAREICAKEWCDRSVSVWDGRRVADGVCARTYAKRSSEARMEAAYGRTAAAQKEVRVREDTTPNCYDG
jgi:hypothetical protein